MPTATACLGSFASAARRGLVRTQGAREVGERPAGSRIPSALSAPAKAWATRNGTTPTPGIRARSGRPASSVPPPPAKARLRPTGTTPTPSRRPHPPSAGAARAKTRARGNRTATTTAPAQPRPALVPLALRHDPAPTRSSPPAPSISPRASQPPAEPLPATGRHPARLRPQGSSQEKAHTCGEYRRAQHERLPVLPYRASRSSCDSPAVPGHCADPRTRPGLRPHQTSALNGQAV